MALGTNYKRNEDIEDKSIAKRLEKAKKLSKELGGNLSLASSVVLGRMSLEQAKREVGK